MKRLPLVVLVAAAAICLPSVTVAADGTVREIAIPGKAFVPDEIDVLVGDTVTWTNSDVTSHTVTAQDDSFDSGYLAPGATFSHTFTRPTTVPYSCTIHRFMRGMLRVVPVALSGPTDGVRPGATVVLRGLAPSGVTDVRIERLGRDSWEPVAHARPGADGTFSARVSVTSPGRFRARVAEASSVVVRVAVAPRVLVQRVNGEIVTRFVPVRPGVKVVLQRYDRELFDWRPVAHATAATGVARIPLTATEGNARYRVVARGSDGWADGISAAFSLR
jgi:plastocyanin